jgi:hypothetical protein
MVVIINGFTIQVIQVNQKETCYQVTLTKHFKIDVMLRNNEKKNLIF